MTLHLSEAEIAALIEPADAVEIIEGAFRRLAAGQVHSQTRVRLPMNGGHLALMGATDGEL
jgi:ornithine cyclodeaminase/alanine dehydrogenase-like protein (mu-crystallin family)